ncbi:MAG: hypothetical protein ACMG6H_17135, partial [Acidobacteriota bacterium]
IMLLATSEHATSASVVSRIRILILSFSFGSITSLSRPPQRQSNYLHSDLLSSRTFNFSYEDVWAKGGKPAASL